MQTDSSGVVMLPGRWFMAASLLAAVAMFAVSRVSALPPWLLATEVLATILGLFLFGSFRYQIHKNALTYGMLLRHRRDLRRPADIGVAPGNRRQGGWLWVRMHLLSFRGLDELIHADTMLFILGLTFFVVGDRPDPAARRRHVLPAPQNRGRILPTVIAVTAVVALASGILDGVSMIGLTIRTLVIIMMLAAAPAAAVRYAVMVCTAVTTICGIWLAYGEPPNLIMKANLSPAAGQCVLPVATALRRPSPPT